MNYQDLKVIDETNHFIVVLKPSGILSQQDITGDPDLLTIVKEYLKAKYHKPGDAYVGLVHRLDRMTSGLMVFGKTSKGSSRLSEMIRRHEFEKRYLAICEGHILEKLKTLNNKIVYNESLKKSFISDTGKEARLSFKVLEYDPLKSLNFPHTLIEVTLFTGRHHQIRVQMASIHHPLVGDTLYGSNHLMPLYLHAYYLSFLDPITKEKKEYTNFPNWK